MNNLGFKKMGVFVLKNVIIFWKMVDNIKLKLFINNLSIFLCIDIYVYVLFKIIIIFVFYKGSN